MHRFIDSGPCPAELFNDSRTLGDYALGFLDHTGTFLSELTITNNGAAIETFPDATGRWEVRHRNLVPPLDRGFAEFTYTVLEVVERQGFLMPVRAVAKRIAADGDTLYDRVVCEFALLALDDLDALGLAALTRPTRFPARDFRIQDLPGPLNCLLTNEAWLPTSDPTLSAEAAFLRGTVNAPGRGGFPFIAALAVLVLLPLMILASSDEFADTRHRME